MCDQFVERFMPITVCYSLGMVVCGTVVIGMADTLTDLADNVGESTYDLTPAFAFRGIGQILATSLCPMVYRRFNGEVIMIICLAMVVVLWLTGSAITNKWVLYLWFYFSGLLTSAVDTGIQILTRVIFREKAGPYLTANTLMYASAGMLSPLVSYVSSGSLWTQYEIYACFTAAVALTLVPHLPIWAALPDWLTVSFGPKGARTAPLLSPAGQRSDLTGNREDVSSATGSHFAQWDVRSPSFSGELLDMSGGVPKAADTGAVVGAPLRQGYLPIKDEGGETFRENSRKGSGGSARLLGAELEEGYWNLLLRGHFNTEVVMCLMIFFGTGVQSAAAFYIDTFIEDTEIVPDSEDSAVLSVFWAAVLLGRGLMTWLQRDISAQGVYRSVQACSVLCCLFPVPLLVAGWLDTYHGWQLWLCVIGWPLFFGPVLGSVFDLSNRVGSNTEEGATMLMFGLNLGGSVVVMTLAILWQGTDIGPSVVPGYLIVGMAIVFVLSLVLPRLNKPLSKKIKKPMRHMFKASVVEDEPGAAEPP